MSYNLEKSFCIYNTEEFNVYLKVAPNEDNPENYIQVYAEGEESVSYHGDFTLTLHKQEAKLLAQALLELAGE